MNGNISAKVIQFGATAIISAFVGLLIFDASSSVYEVPLPLYGTIGLIFGGGAALGFRNTQSKDDKKEGGNT